MKRPRKFSFRRLNISIISNNVFYHSLLLLQYKEAIVLFKLAYLSGQMRRGSVKCRSEVMFSISGGSAGATFP